MKIYIWKYLISNCISLYFLVGSETWDFKNTASLRGAKRLTVKFRDSDELLPPSKKYLENNTKFQKKQKEIWGGGIIIVTPI